MKIRKISKASLARTARFVKRVNAMLEEVGASPTPRGMYAYTIETPVGPLGISAGDGHIHSRFTSSKGGQAAVGCGHTGKWNFYCADAAGDLESLAEYFKYQLTNLMEYKPTPAVLRDVKLDLCEDRCQRIQWAQWAAERAREREAAPDA